MSLARNIELKARLADPAAARFAAERLATGHLGIERQRDTYFVCPHGRLKLREIAEGATHLIAYQRPDRPDAKASDYRLVEILDANSSHALYELLESALGILIVVDKTREVFLYENVRIHLDEVAGLGKFLEFEAVIGGIVDDALAKKQVAWLTEQFGIAARDLMNSSYSDMLLESARGR